eukprot:TRINITY_DN44304_c0_g1_i2.p1 TRINITY_DN44304_c0_g1~~TRINITY_DN44304_c0_g1_i2.p1  ORF type:complete len:183 (-),score=38.60 TRINITY_DN44304_c0_g1_i2:57-605(-)
MIFFFQAEDGIRDLVRSRGLGDVYKRQALPNDSTLAEAGISPEAEVKLVGVAAWRVMNDLDGWFAAVKGADLDGLRNKLTVRPGMVEVRDSKKANGTALHWAAYYGHLEVATVLLDAKALVDSRDWQEETPLHNAAEQDFPQMITLLLAAGADRHARDKWDGTPIQRAADFADQSTRDALSA